MVIVKVNMKKKLLVIGSGGHSRAVLDAAVNMACWEIEGVIDPSFDGVPEKIFSFPVLGGLNAIGEFDPAATDIFVAIGSNIERRKVTVEIAKLHYSFPVIIHPRACISSKAKLGCGVFIGAFAHIGPYADIGDGCIVNTHANVEHEVALGNFSQIASNSVICGRSIISENVFIGANATVIDKIYVAEGVLIGAASVVLKDIPEAGSTVVGVPGRRI